MILKVPSFLLITVLSVLIVPTTSSASNSFNQCWDTIAPVFSNTQNNADFVASICGRTLGGFMSCWDTLAPNYSDTEANARFVARICVRAGPNFVDCWNARRLSYAGTYDNLVLLAKRCAL